MNTLGLSMSRDDSGRWDGSAGIGSNPAPVTASSARFDASQYRWFGRGSKMYFHMHTSLTEIGESTLCSTLMGFCIFLKSFIFRRLVDVDSVRSIKQATKTGLL